MSDKSIIIIGYSLDSAILARDYAVKQGKHVTYLQSGVLGYPYDDINERISYEDVLYLNTLGIHTEFKKYINDTYVFMPYDSLKFVNTRNGLISYPLNKSSFDSAEEWEELSFCLYKLNEFREMLNTATNFINIYKNFFPKWLYDSLLKYIGVNKWGNIRQSKFSKEALAKEINLSYLDSKNTGISYAPVNGYSSLCEELLNFPTIYRDKISLHDAKKMVTKRYNSSDIIYCDNRIDYMCNYSCGKFDRVKYTVENSTENNTEEFIDISEGFVLTPAKDYWGILSDHGTILKLYSTLIDELNYVEQSEIPMTIKNNKMYDEYKKMLNLYSGKQLNLNNRAVTVIK